MYGLFSMICVRFSCFKSEQILSFLWSWHKLRCFQSFAFGNSGVAQVHRGGNRHDMTADHEGLSIKSSGIRTIKGRSRSSTFHDLRYICIPYVQGVVQSPCPIMFALNSWAYLLFNWSFCMKVPLTIMCIRFLQVCFEELVRCWATMYPGVCIVITSCLWALWAHVGDSLTIVRKFQRHPKKRSKIRNVHTHSWVKKRESTAQGPNRSWNGLYPLSSYARVGVMVFDVHHWRRIMLPQRRTCGMQLFYIQAGTWRERAQPKPFRFTTSIGSLWWTGLSLSLLVPAWMCPKSAVARQFFLPLLRPRRSTTRRISSITDPTDSCNCRICCWCNQTVKWQLCWMSSSNMQSVQLNSWPAFILIRRSKIYGINRTRPESACCQRLRVGCRRESIMSSTVRIP